jgi:2-alkenal reductase
VAAVVPNTPAQAAGLHPYDRGTGVLGDVIVAVNGQRVDGLSAFVRELDRVGIGNTAELTVERGQSQRMVKLKVMDVPR